MLPIYICEDDAMILAAQRKFLEKQIMMEGYDMQIALCSRHPQEIIEAVAADQREEFIFWMWSLRMSRWMDLCWDNRFESLIPEVF